VAPIFEGDAPRLGPTGEPELAMLFMPVGQVQIIDTWHVTGMRATGTHDLYAEDVFVGDDFAGAFDLPAGPKAVRECVLAVMPFFTVIGVAQSPPACLGIARRAIEEFTEIALNKESPFGPRLSERVQAHAGLARAEGLLRSARAYWYQSVQEAWDNAVAGHAPTPVERAHLRIASVMAVENSAAATDLLYRLAGSSAIFQTSPLERCWRDVHTAAQHAQVQDARWETAGRVLFGLEPGSPFL
jgi:alkylation response protein AidB-like acyl-CoA dehydrogenase